MDKCCTLIFNLALIYHLENISKKLSKQGLFARSITAFAHTNRFKHDYLCNSVNVIFPTALDSYRLMAKYTNSILDVIYRSEIQFKKSGIIVTDIVSSEHQTMDLFDRINIRRDSLKPTLDIINRKFGKHSIGLAAALLCQDWKMQREHLSGNYTTEVEELLTISI